MILTGFGLGILVIIVNSLFFKKRDFKISVIGFALGIYLPMSMMFPLFLGGVISKLVDLFWNKQPVVIKEERNTNEQRGLLVACGLVAVVQSWDCLFRFHLL